MTLVSSSIPNLINGVSQQPAILRLPSQSEVQVNALSSPVEGLRKRPPTVFKRSIDGIASQGSLLSHNIARDGNERYQVLLTSSDIRVLDLVNHVDVPVTFQGNAKDYLKCDDPSSQLRAMTVADHTFVLNREKPTAMLPDVIAPRRPGAVIWVKQGLFGSKYTIKLDGAEVSFMTPSRAATDEEWTAGYRYVSEDGTVPYNPPISTALYAPPRELPKTLTQAHAATDYITKGLYDVLTNAGSGTLLTKFDFTLRGSLILVQPKAVNGVYPDFTVSSSDSQGEATLKVFKDKVQRFTDLPAVCFNGFRLKVMGDDATEFDDYYVVYEGDKTGGVWIEDIADGEVYKIDGSTMPHALVRQEDGTFLFKPLAWDDRKCGDSASVEPPSIIGKKIKDVFFYRNRLGMVAQESVVMSRYGDFYNLWRASATQTLDTDPIDVIVAHTKVSDLYHAVPFNETLVLFGEHTQFQIADTDLLTPKTVAFRQTTEFSCDPETRPVGIGNHLYFVHKRGEYAKVNEYYVDRETASKTANDITSHVPKYIPGAVSVLATSTNENLLVALPQDQRNRLYVYNHLWVGEEKVQAAWHHWEFDEDAFIVAASFVESELWLTVSRNGTLYLECMNLAPGVTTEGADYLIHLDRCVSQEDASVVYDAALDVTSITLPYRPVDGMKVIAQAGNVPSDALSAVSNRYLEGEEAEWAYIQESNGSLITVPGRLEKFWVGLPYTMQYRFSTFYLREEKTTGDFRALVDGRLQMRKLALAYVDSGYFKVTVTTEGRAPSEYVMTAKVIGQRGTTISRQRTIGGNFGVPLLSQNTRVTVDILNDSYLPSTFISAEWEGQYVSHARRNA